MTRRRSPSPPRGWRWSPVLRAISRLSAQAAWTPWWLCATNSRVRTLRRQYFHDCDAEGFESLFVGKEFPATGNWRQTWYRLPCFAFQPDEESRNFRNGGEKW